MAEHDEDRIMAVLIVFGRATPLFGRQSSKPVDEPMAVLDIFLKGFIEVHLEKEIIGVTLARIVRRDHRRRRREDLFQSIKKESVHIGKMACMLVRGPLPDSRTLFERRRLDLPYQRHHDAWGSLERFNYGRRIHENASVGLTMSRERTSIARLLPTGRGVFTSRESAPVLSPKVDLALPVGARLISAGNPMMMTVLERIVRHMASSPISLGPIPATQ